jgi:hypothetical protein
VSGDDRLRLSDTGVADRLQRERRTARTTCDLSCEQAHDRRPGELQHFHPG